MWPTARPEHVAVEAVLSRRPFCAGFQLPLSWKPLLLSAVLLPLYVLIRSMSTSCDMADASGAPFSRIRASNALRSAFCWALRASACSLSSLVRFRRASYSSLVSGAFRKRRRWGSSESDGRHQKLVNVSVTGCGRRTETSVASPTLEYFFENEPDAQIVG